MAGLITMDDLTNEQIINILDDATRLLPVAKGELFLPLLQGQGLFLESLKEALTKFLSAMFCLNTDSNAL